MNYDASKFDDTSAAVAARNGDNKAPEKPSTIG
jgi:hypothetical protein